MKITLSLFLPLPDGQRVRGRILEIHPDTTIEQLINQFSVEDGQVWLYVVNHRETRLKSERLKDGDHLMVFPPMGGG